MNPVKATVEITRPLHGQKAMWNEAVMKWSLLLLAQVNLGRIQPYGSKSTITSTVPSKSEI